MKIHHLVISIILISVLVLGTTSFLADLGENYGATADTSNLNSTLVPILEEYNNKTQELADDIEDMTLSSDDVSGYTLPYVMIKTAWDVGGVFFGAWGVVAQMISLIGSELADAGIPLPEWLLGSIIAILAVTFIAIIVYAFFKWKMED